MIGVNDPVRLVREQKLVEAGREGTVLSRYEYPDKNGKIVTSFKVRFNNGPIMVVNESDVEGGLLCG